jgi:hypothetical protein
MVEEYPPFDKHGVSNTFSIAPKASVRNLLLSQGKGVATIKTFGTELVLTDGNNKTINSAVLIDVKGAIIAKGQRTAADQQRFSVGSIPAGLYVLSWHSANSISSRFITIAR